MSLFNGLFYADYKDDLFSDNRSLQRLLTVEAALAEAQSDMGIIPRSAAELIMERCRMDYIDTERLEKDIPLGGNAAVPLVKQLIEIVESYSIEASKYVHLGATSQDIIDTALVLGLREAYTILDQQIRVLARILADLAASHRETIMIGRTLLQHAKPMTFGFKVSNWLQALLDAYEGFAGSRHRILKIQLGGAVGSGNAFLTRGVRKRLSEILELEYSIPWQTNRIPITEWVTGLGIISGVLGKIAKDIALQMQTEVGEVTEGQAPGKGGSSAMPHKRNPVTCSAITANTHRIPHLAASVISGMTQEHERSTGLWHSEWEVVENITELTLGSLDKSIQLIDSLEIHPERMMENIEKTRGLVYAENVSSALAPKIGRRSANEWVEKACRTAGESDRHLKELVNESEHSLKNLEELFNSGESIRCCEEIVSEILENYESYENQL